jgi:hypothetical protein
MGSVLDGACPRGVDATESCTGVCAFHRSGSGVHRGAFGQKARLGQRPFHRARCRVRGSHMQDFAYGRPGRMPIGPISAELHLSLTLDGAASKTPRCAASTSCQLQKDRWLRGQYRRPCGSRKPGHDDRALGSAPGRGLSLGDRAHRGGRLRKVTALMPVAPPVRIPLG